MSSKHVYEKMLSDIRLLLQSTSQLPYISGKNALTALSIDGFTEVIFGYDPTDNGGDE